MSDTGQAPLTAELAIARSLHLSIETALQRIGLMVRVFSRVKTQDSINKKLTRKSGAYIDGKKMQDLFGIRVTAYFPDDTEIISDALKISFRHVGSSIDEPDQVTFGPTRYNLVFALPDEHASSSALIRDSNHIDSTFEVQLRTVLSEGWHEVEHDLRYKCREDWDDSPDLYRALNGIVATLETCDWSMLKLFEEHAHRHYRAKRWGPMLRSKFRLRVADGALLPGVENYLNSNPGFAKRLFRVDRMVLLKDLLRAELRLPTTWSNLVFVANYLYIDDENVRSLEPRIVKASLEERRSLRVSSGR
jgi:putative GTP pyrophosphokinase